MFKQIILSISFFNSLCIVCLASDNFIIPLSYQNFAVILLDFSILLYGFIVPIVSYRNSDKWPPVLHKLLRKLFCQTRRYSISPEGISLPPIRINNTFGRNMMLSQDAQTTEYFKYLQKMWK
ncbi:hypothetical protein WR25_12725 [Diploscapter pachys]|uniref:Uncharacterized protein n=1 Tax=Diploscapter pachys TaxID=2018661 RepID=A0A2A2LLA0_9BILA|nr:hypothetical protein WR25_12725 [Diploscapter pachys]